MARIEEWREECGVAEPFHFVVAATDGEEIHAVRYSSDHRSCSLFTSRDATPLRELDPRLEVPPDSILIASEPPRQARALDRGPGVDYIVAGNDRVEQRPFVPRH